MYEECIRITNKIINLQTDVLKTHVLNGIPESNEENI